MRELRARPSGSRTVRTATISTGRSRSATRRRITASCWASFWPKKATSGRTIGEQLGHDGGHAVEVACRAAPSSVSVSGPPTCTMVAKPGRVHARRRSARRRRRRRPSSSSARSRAFVARIADEILARAELRGVDEERGGDAGAAFAAPRARAPGGPRAGRPWWAPGPAVAAGRPAWRAPRRSCAPPSSPASLEQVLERAHRLVVEPRGGQRERFERERPVGAGEALGSRRRAGADGRVPCPRRRVRPGR